MEKPIQVATPAAAEAKAAAHAEPKAAPAPALRSSSGQTSPSHAGHVTWDEETIAKHDLERGTRQKIEEPNTPYHYYSGSALEAADAGDVSPARSLSGRESQQGVEFSELEAKLQGVQQGAKKSEWDSSDDEDGASSVSSASSRGVSYSERDAEGRKLHHDPKFAEKRKMHYNEFERVRAWKLQHAAEDEEDEEEEDEDEKAEAGEASKAPAAQ